MKFSIRHLFVIVLFCGIFYITLRPILDPDFWWHLRTGQLIAQTKAIPSTDPFSFTANGSPWVTHEWLSELAIFKVYQLGNYAALILLFSAIITASYIFTYLRCPKESRPYAAGFMVLLGAIASAPLWGVRPQMVTLLFASIFLFFLDRFRQNGKLRTLIPLPLLMLLWVNLHAGYILGIGIAAMYLTGGLIEAGVSKYFRKENIEAGTQKTLWSLFGVLGACVLAALLNPTGFRILIYPFQTLFDPAMQLYLQEWLSPDFHQKIWLPFAIMILALIGTGMVGKHPVSITKILLTLVFGYASLRSVRHIPLFAIAVVPILAEQISALLKMKLDPQEPTRLFRWVSPLLISVLVVVIALNFIQVTKNQQKSEAQTFPKAAVDWIIENKPKGNIFNSYTWGGYLIWKLYPDYLVYIDGRPDMYGAKFVSDYAGIYFAEPGWEKELDQKNIQLVFVESQSRLANTLRLSSAWKILFEDQASVIFSKD